MSRCLHDQIHRLRRAELCMALVKAPVFFSFGFGKGFFPQIALAIGGLTSNRRGVGYQLFFFKDPSNIL